MERRVALAFLILTVPLLVYPIVSPPPDPPDRLVHRVSELPGSDNPDGEGVVRYENLSDRGQDLFKEALEESPYRVPVVEGAPEFRYEPFGSTIVHYEGTNYRLLTTRAYTGPSVENVVLRLGSLVLGIIAGTIGGYGWVNAEG